MQLSGGGDGSLWNFEHGHGHIVPGFIRHIISDARMQWTGAAQVQASAIQCIARYPWDP